MRERRTVRAVQAGGLSPEQEGVLKIMQKTFECYITENPEAKVRTIPTCLCSMGACAAQYQCACVTCVIMPVP